MDELQPFLALGLAREREPAKQGPADWEIRELNHRMANSLQLAVDVLGLQLQRSPDPATRAALEDAMARLAAVGQLHRHLSVAEPHALVDMASFLRELAPVIGLGTGLACELSVDPIRLPAKMAQYVGLLINECAINARKHAYGFDGGVLQIECAVTPGRLTVSVADQGRGIRAVPEGQPPGLGMTIIEAILNELGGRMSVESRNGARFSFLIPISAAAPGLDRSFATWSEP